MPRFCGVVGCSNTEGRENKSFFKLPNAQRKYGDRQLALKRRIKWLVALRRKGLTEQNAKHILICEDHFISGKPAGKSDIDNPDWVPSVNMGYTTTNQTFGAAISRNGRAHVRKVTTGAEIFDGHPASNSDIENPDLVPSITSNHPEKPQNSSYVSPHIEYIKKSVVSQNKSDETAYRNQSSLRIRRRERILDKDSNVSDITESSTMFVFENTSLEKNIEEINSLKKNVSNEERVLPEEFFVHSKVMTSYKNAENEGIISDEENFLSDFSDSNSVLHQNMLSKKVQTDLTMIDLDKIYKALKTRVNEVNQLKGKLKNLTEDILHLNEMYC